MGTEDKDNKDETFEKVKNLQPPDMIKKEEDFDIYKKRLKRWSRLSSLSPQTQFDLILNSMNLSHPLCSKLEEEIGDSEDAATKGVDVILSKLEEMANTLHQAFIVLVILKSFIPIFFIADE